MELQSFCAEISNFKGFCVKEILQTRHSAYEKEQMVKCLRPIVAYDGYVAAAAVIHSSHSAYEKCEMLKAFFGTA